MAYCVFAFYASVHSSVRYNLLQEIIGKFGPQHPDARQLSQLAVPHFYLWLAERQLDCLSVASTGAAADVKFINVVMTMLNVAAESSASKLPQFALRCQKISNDLKQKREISASQTAQNFEMPRYIPTINSQTAFSATVQVPPSIMPNDVQTLSPSEIVKHRKRNLPWLPGLFYGDDGSCEVSFARTIEWLTENRLQMTGTMHMGSQLVLYNIERLVFKCSTSLDTPPIGDISQVCSLPFASFGTIMIVHV
jgi:hypothetical protein